MKKLIICLCILLITGFSIIQAETTLTNTSAESNSELMAEAEKYRSQIMNDPETMQDVESVVNDPQFRAVASDPEVMQALQAQDIKALMANEKFMGLVNSPKIQGLTKKLTEENANKGGLTGASPAQDTSTN